jgi:hypothetical protein
VARISQEAQEIVDNVMAAAEGIAKVLPKKWATIQSLYLKTSVSHEPMKLSGIVGPTLCRASFLSVGMKNGSCPFDSIFHSGMARASSAPRLNKQQNPSRICALSPDFICTW